MEVQRVNTATVITVSVNMVLDNLVREVARDTDPYES
jgi:hypothetical protein